jgi:hypothetical protein
VLRAILTSCIAAILLASTPALANGRFPRSGRLLEDAQDPSHLVLGATFGMLVTRDAGLSWRHVCEASFGDPGLSTDPVIAFTPDGGILAGIYASVGRSAPDACDFRKTLGMDNRQAVPDFTLVASVPGRAVAVLISLGEDGVSENQLYQSDDRGESWATLGPPLPSSLRTIATVEVAPSNANRIYVSGLDADGAGLLLRSDDSGQSFDALAVPTDVAHQEVPYIAAVDAVDPDAIYLRTDVWVYDPIEQVANANDALLYSSDGGAHFTELLREGGKLFGFTFSPDGQELLVGYGDPVEGGGGRLTDPDALGIYRAPTGSSNFEKRYAGSIGCLTWTEQGLYACTLEAETGFSLGLTTTTDFDLATPAKLTPLLRLKDVVGPLQCPACSSGSICRNYWQSSCESWGRTDCESLIPATPDACGGAGSEGPASPAGNAGQSGESATTPSKPNSHASGGCACRMGAAQDRSGAWCAIFGVGLLFPLRRRFSAARRAAGGLRFGGSRSGRTQTARALDALRRRDPA